MCIVSLCRCCSGTRYDAISKCGVCFLLSVAVFFFHVLTVFSLSLLPYFFQPFVLMCVLPSNTERIVSFFQEFTLYVDGLGHCCSYAYFPGMHSFGNAKVTWRRLTSCCFFVCFVLFCFVNFFNFFLSLFLSLFFS